MGGFSEFLRRNSTAATVVVAVLLGLTVVWIFGQLFGGPPAPRVVDVYFYDLNTGELFVGRSDDESPQDTDSSGPFGQPAGVRAHVIGCGECPDNPTTADVGWVGKHTTQAGPNGTEYELYVIRPTASLGRGPDEGQWVNPISPPGLALVERIRAEKCGNADDAIECTAE